ncbi:Protein of unknown function [Lactobacillus helveticus CIRM-BIA 953]|uniref:Uncharacterized protein n=1 Tax=Lactobacillus helveticus CIRM-BIA 953 TaxID=1226335 RepID=U4QCC6_LACHE|nr:Protein of unknown function [Lactobacillus helveticus CIRM-BIA 953]
MRAKLDLIRPINLPIIGIM